MCGAAAVMLVAGSADAVPGARPVPAGWPARISRASCGSTAFDIRVHRRMPLPAGQTVFVSNHTSTLDLFVLVALGLPDCRFFLSGFLRKLVPLGVISWMLGTFFTVPQDRPQRARPDLPARRARAAPDRRVGLPQPRRRPRHDRRDRPLQQGRLPPRHEPARARSSRSTSASRRRSIRASASMPGPASSTSSSCPPSTRATGRWPTSTRQHGVTSERVLTRAHQELSCAP